MILSENGDLEGSDRINFKQFMGLLSERVRARVLDICFCEVVPCTKPFSGVLYAL